jgi:hypothetical protein
MHICFACGGKLKVIAKPGRMYEDETGELYEIPAELKIPTCLDCGTPHEDTFITGRIERSVASQKKIDPGLRIKMLRYIDKHLRDVFKRPAMWGGAEAVESLTYQGLLIRQVLLDKGELKDTRKIHNALTSFCRKRFPKHNNAGNPLLDPKLDLDTEVAPMLSEFCDIVVNTLE